MNYVPLSVIMMLVILNWWIMSVKKRMACSERMFVMGRASMHLENLSTATSKWVYPPAAFCTGPTRSRPHTANGHVMGIN